MHCRASLSEDPIGFAAGDYNLNRYVGNRLLSNVDPYGLQKTYTLPPYLTIPMPGQLLPRSSYLSDWDYYEAMREAENRRSFWREWRKWRSQQPTPGHGRAELRSIRCVVSCRLQPLGIPGHGIGRTEVPPLKTMRDVGRQ